MIEFTFRITHDKDCNKVDIVESGNVVQTHYYHSETDDCTMLWQTMHDWIGADYGNLN